MTTSPQEPLSDDDIETAGSADATEVVADSDGTDGDAIDTTDGDGTDGDGTDGTDGDGTDGTDGDGTDGDSDGTDS